MKRFHSAIAILTLFVLILGASLLHYKPSFPNFGFKASYKGSSSEARPSSKALLETDKFDANGTALHFTGNTILCHLSNSNASELYSSLLVLHDKLKQSHLSHLYTLLPPSSWHMTVFEGVAYNRRKPGLWPSDLPKDASLEECTALYEKRLSSFDLQARLPFRLSVLAPSEVKSTVKLLVRPLAADEAALRNVRDRLVDVLDIHNPNHESYVFHIGLAYILRRLTGPEETELMSIVMDHFIDMPKEFELGSPEFCKYESMLEFEPLLYLNTLSSPPYINSKPDRL